MNKKQVLEGTYSRTGGGWAGTNRADVRVTMTVTEREVHGQAAKDLRLELYFYNSGHEALTGSAIVASSKLNISVVATNKGTVRLYFIPCEKASDAGTTLIKLKNALRTTINRTRKPNNDDLAMKFDMLTMIKSGMYTLMHDKECDLYYISAENKI